MKLTSLEFQNNNQIPVKFSCQGQGVNPELLISDVPEFTKSLVLILDDPDAPNGTFTHWIVANMPPEILRIDENSVPPGIQIINTTGNINFVAPCPPSGNHHYIFELFALDAVLNIDENILRAKLDQLISEHLIEKTELIGMYEKK